MLIELNPPGPQIEINPGSMLAILCQNGTSLFKKKYPISGKKQRAKNIKEPCIRSDHATAINPPNIT